MTVCKGNFLVSQFKTTFCVLLVLTSILILITFVLNKIDDLFIGPGVIQKLNINVALGTIKLNLSLNSSEYHPIKQLLIENYTNIYGGTGGLKSINLKKCEHSANRSIITSGHHRAHFAVVPLSDRTKHVVISNIREKLNISHVIFTVKSTLKLHKKRLQILMDTWISLVLSQTYIVTDGGENGDTSVKSLFPENHYVDSESFGCETKREGLCCKSQVEWNIFLKTDSRYQWLCRCDDDTYFNLQALSKFLQSYDSSKYLVLGVTGHYKKKINTLGKVPFAFGSGGMCITRALIEKFTNVYGDQGLMKICQEHGIGEDVAVGVAANRVHNKSVHPIKVMNKHSGFIKSPAEIIRQVTFCYRVTSTGTGWSGQLELRNGAFSVLDDPSRFYSVHAFLYPTIPHCRLFPPNTTAFSGDNN